MAQATQAPERTTGGIQDIVVTAQKREQNLQVVPVAVTALQPQALTVNRVTNLVDLGSVAPGTTVRNTPGGLGEPQIVIRGALSASNFACQDHAISINVDGVYIGTPYGNAFDIPDLERVEVLRGPQGTLFGRNSTGGAINLITRDPSGKFGFHEQVSIGNYDERRTVTRVETPQIGPFSAYVSFVHDERRGDIKNLASNIVWDRSNSDRYGLQKAADTLGAKNSNGLRAAVKFAPSDNFKMVYKFDHVRNHFTPDATGLIVFSPEVLLGYGIPPAYVQAITDAVNALPGHGVTTISRPKALYNGFSTPGFTKTDGHTLTSTLNLNDKLSIKNITAYRKTFIYANSDFAGLGQPLFIGGNPVPSYITGGSFDSFDNQFSSELQLNYNSRFLTLTAGALYFHEHTNAGTDAGLANTGNAAFTPLPGNKFPAGLDRDDAHIQSIAGFGQAEVHLTNQLTLVGGVRVTQDKKHGTSYVSTLPYPIEYKKTQPTFEVGANYQLSNILLYGKYSTGFISGGSISGIAFAPEKAKSWEVGLKSDWFDRRVRFNLATYIVKYSDIQSTVLGYQVGHPELFQVLASLGDANVKGFEAELTVAPINGLTVDGSLSYSHFKYTRINPIFGVSDYPVWLRPTWTANASVTYETQPIAGDANLMFRIDGDYRSHITSPGFFSDPGPAYAGVYKTGDNWIFNARIAVQKIKMGPSHGEIALWARNLANNKDPLFGLFNGYGASTSYQPARTYGVDFTVDF